jgi:hypothetical protein
MPLFTQLPRRSVYSTSCLEEVFSETQRQKGRVPKTLLFVRQLNLVLTVLIAVLQLVGFGFLLLIELLLGSLGVLFGLLAMRAGRRTGGKVIAAINVMGLLTALLILLLVLFLLPSV